MSLVSEIIANLRYKINDTKAANYKDQELLVYLNEGNRLLRKLVAKHAPALIAVLDSGSTEKDVANFDLPTRFMKIIETRIYRRPPLPVIDRSEIRDLTETGRPEAYYLQGLKTICWVPIPDAVYSYSISYVPEATKLQLPDDTGWPSDFEDYIAEYIVIRAGIRDEANMDAEAQFMARFGEDIVQLLSDITPETTVVQGYFGSYSGVSDY